MISIQKTENLYRRADRIMRAEESLSRSGTYRYKQKFIPAELSFVALIHAEQINMRLPLGIDL